MRFEILGPIRAHTDLGEVAVTAVRERTLLAVLLLHANNLVPLERLVEAIWGDRPPRDVRNQVQVCVSRLRRRLAGADASGPGDVIVTDPAGYRLRADPYHVDLLDFRRLTADARSAAVNGRPDEARDRYRAGLGLWRGPALAGIDSDLMRRAAAAVDEERVRAHEECIEVELAAGGAGELVPELTDLVRQHPYRESLHDALMRALYRAGRHADALAAYRHLRQLLHDELGTEPGPELERLHRLILSRDSELDRPQYARPARMGSAAPMPRELPAEASCFVGREAELAHIRSVLGQAGAPDRRRPAVMLLYGPGGVGKSALAVRAAHDLAAEFSDGQLYVDLHGSTPGMRPLPAAEALGRLLRSVGVHPSEVPSGEDEAATLFRSVTVDRRLLLVLDNVADREHVTSLLPSAPTCVVLITSRQPLPTLDYDGRIRVGPLPDPEALALLAGLTGGHTMDPEAAQSIVTHSGGLPLAVRIAAGRLASRPDLPVQEYAARLADRSRRLDELRLDDLAVRASIRTGYDALLTSGDPVGRLAARAFRALGVLHVPDVAPGVVAAMLSERDVETARAALDRLVDTQLLEPVPPGRYRLHDLVRLVASERAADEDSPADRDRTLHRAIAYYTGALWQAEERLNPSRILPFSRPPIPGDVPLPSFGTLTRARAWVDEEIVGLVPALEQALTSAGGNSLTLLWLSDALWLQLDSRCDWQKAHRVSRAMLAAADRRGDRKLTAWGLLLHGRSESCLGRNEAAEAAFERALVFLRSLGNDTGVALALNGLGLVNMSRGRPSDALVYYAQALDAVRMRDWYLTANILSNTCVGYAVLGKLKYAARAGEDSLALAEDTKSRASASINLASVYCMRGDHAEAVRLLDGALAVEEVGDGMRTCESLVIRSEAHLRSGNLSRAAADAERALSEAQVWGYRFVAAAAKRQRARIFTTMGREADAVRARALADEAYAQLIGAFRDPLTEHLLAQELPA